MLALAQISVSIIIIALILLQKKSSGMGAMMGGEDSGTYQTRRGLEKLIYYATILLIVVFAGLALLNLLV